MPTNKSKNTFSGRDIAESCNNTVVRALRPSSLGEPSDRRLQQLRAYSQGLLAPTLRHVEDEVLRPEELVIVLSTAALFVQLKYVLQTDKVPQGPRVMDIYDGPEAVILPERYLETPEPGDDEVLPAKAPAPSVSPKKRGRKPKK